MKITIVGAGLIGTYLAQYLSGEQMDIYIIDKDASRLTLLDSEYNLMTVLGDGTEFDTLHRAEVEKSDLLIAVTGVTERNIVICGIAKSMGTRMTVARVDRADYVDEKNEPVLRTMGVDKAVFPEFLLAKGIVQSLRHPWTRAWYGFNRGTLIMMGMRLMADAPICGKRLRELASMHRYLHIAAVRRHYTTMIPGGDFELQPDDILFITTTNSQDELAKLIGKEAYEIKRVLISGSDKLVEMTLNKAPKSLNFTVIESDVKRAKRLVSRCPGCDVIVGEAYEMSVLEEAGIHKADAFVALTDSSEGNILACLTARDLGVKKTVAHVEQQHFFNMAESFHIGTIVNQQMLMANAVFQLLMDSGSLSSKCLALPDAEMIRLEINPGSKVTEALVRDLKIPAEITFAGYIRDGQSYIVNGNTQLKPGDHLLVVCLQGGFQKAQTLFNV